MGTLLDGHFLSLINRALTEYLGAEFETLDYAVMRIRIVLQILDYRFHPELEHLESDILKWQVVDPLLYENRLDSLLKRHDIQQAFGDAALAYDSLERWKCLESSDFSRYPHWTLNLRDGHQHYLPVDAERSDWRCQIPRERPSPLFLSYVCAGASYCMAFPNLLLARGLIPELQWMVLKSELHTTVVCPGQRLIFDLNHAPFAMNVSGPETVELMLKGNKPREIYDQDLSYLFINTGLIQSIVAFFEIADNCMVPFEQLLRDFLAKQFCIDEAKEITGLASDQKLVAC